MMHLLIRLLMLAVFLFAMGDVWSTNRAISVGAKEANPVMAFFMRLLKEKWCIARIMFAQMNIFFVMHSSTTRESWQGATAFGLNCALMSYVIWNNIKVYKKQIAPAS